MAMQKKECKCVKTCDTYFNCQHQTVVYVGAKQTVCVLNHGYRVQSGDERKITHKLLTLNNLQNSP